MNGSNSTSYIHIIPVCEFEYCVISKRTCNIANVNKNMITSMEVVSCDFVMF